MAPLFNEWHRFSNIHFGYVALKLGISENFAEFGAGVAQSVDQRNESWFSAAYNADIRPYYGDEPEDNAAIQIGYEFYRTGDLCKALKRYSSKLKSVKECNPTTRKNKPNVNREKRW